MTRVGANTWIWVSPLTDERLARIAPRVRDWGFDVIELPVEQPGDWDAASAADLLAGLGLGATLCAVMPPGRDLTDPALVASTQDYLRTCVDIAAVVGSGVVAGPMYAPVGKTWLLSAQERGPVLDGLAEALRPVADHAAERGVTLAVEPLNRYETSLVNTVAQAKELLERLDHPAVGLALDTFHMNMEERSLPGAIREAGPHLAHLQVCANDRGAPGSDHLDWPGIAAAVTGTGYGGPWCIESFTAENRTIATAAAIWRPLAPTQDALATSGLAFLRELLPRR